MIKTCLSITVFVVSLKTLIMIEIFNLIHAENPAKGKGVNIVLIYAHKFATVESVNLVNSRE
jgi:hypothetical protein